MLNDIIKNNNGPCNAKIKNFSFHPQNRNLPFFKSKSLTFSNTLKLSSLACFLLLVLIKTNVSAKNFYLSGSQGNDRMAGTSADQPWKSLQKLGQINFNPGDRILLKSGDTFTGAIHLENLQGAEGQEIVIGTYGGDARAIIHGKDTRAAIFILNPSYVRIENLEVTNPGDQYGILMEARSAGELQNVTLANLDVHDVFDEAFERTNTPKTRGGIVFKVEGDDKPSWWDGIVIENSVVHDLGSCGISIGSDYKVNKDPESDEKRYPILGVRIRNNIIHDIVRDGAIIRQCKGAIIENNEVYRTGLTSVSNGIWFYDSDSCIIQNNIGHHCKAAHDKDGAPFSLDNHTTNCIIQYNYSHSNEGAGYMLFGHNDTEHGNIIRHNISYNDVTNIASDGIGAIAIVSRVKDALVYDNVIIAGPATQSILGHRDWDGLPVEVNYENNLFVGNGTAYFDKDVMQGGNFKDNFFINVVDLPEALQNDDGNRVSDYYQKLQQKIMGLDSINSYNIEKY